MSLGAGGSGSDGQPAPSRWAVRFTNPWTYAISAAWLVSGALYLTLPPTSDQFDHEYIGWRILEGEVPYRDFIDENWPGAFWLHALAVLLFGNRLWAWHLLDFTLFGVGVWFLQDLLRRSVGSEASRAAVILAPLFYVAMPQWFAGQHDVTASHLLLPALWFHVRAYTENRTFLQSGTGIFLGLAALAKPTAALLGPLLVAQALLLGLGWKKVLMHTLLAAGSSVGVVLAGFGVVLAQGSSMQDLKDCLWTSIVNARSVGGSSYLELTRYAGLIHLAWWHVLTLTAAVGAVLTLRPERRSLGSTSPITLWISGLASYAVQGRPTAYHLGSCLQALLQLDFIALGILWNVAPGLAGALYRRRLAWGFSALLLLGMGIKLVRNYGSLIPSAVHGDYSRHLSRFEGAYELPVSSMLILARDCEQRVPPGESILTLDAVNGINFLSKRRQSSRIVYGAILLKLPPALEAKWTEQWCADLTKRRPLWCAIHEDMHSAWLGADSRAARFLRGLLDEAYRPLELSPPVSRYRVYVRR
jgi:hypothetical protein